MALKKGQKRHVFTADELEDIAYAVNHTLETKGEIAKRYNITQSNLSMLFRSKKYKLAERLINARVETQGLYRDSDITTGDISNEC